jgi:hypothetical protein
VRLCDHFLADAARLLSAAFQNACKCLRLYIRKGYDCNLKAQSTESKLALPHVVTDLRCSDCDKGSMIQSLISGGAAVDARELEGKTPLMVLLQSMGLLQLS